MVLFTFKNRIQDLNSHLFIFKAHHMRFYFRVQIFRIDQYVFKQRHLLDELFCSYFYLYILLYRFLYIHLHTNNLFF